MANVISQVKLPDGTIYSVKDNISGYVATEATTSAKGLMSASDKTKLNGIASGAEVNQNAFSNVTVGTTTVAADSKTDTLTLEGGANITLTPDATNDKITISLDDTVDTGEVIATDIQTGNLIVNGSARFLNAINGDISGSAATATSATKATQDESGNNIKSTYASAISISDHTITLKNKNGTSLGTVTVPDNNTTYTVDTGTANGKIKVTPSAGNAYEVSVYGLKSAAYKDVTDTYSETGTDPVSGKAVKAAIDGLPSPMVFRGTVGAAAQNPTVTSLPVDGTAVVGDTYKVITNGTYGGKASKVGDTLICLTKTSSANTWEIVPSGDEPSGTVTSVAISNGGGLSVSGSPITSSGTITISHADTSSQASVNNSDRTYIQDITLDTYGHVTGITSATETVVNTDRYVNSAAFVDATSADANNPVKMTLTRAGSDTASVTAYIPKVSSSSAGVVPKGAAVSSQSKTTKFLREDGTWAVPSYTTDTNTTYTIGTSGNTVTLTPSSGNVQSITVPYATSAGSATDNTKLPLSGGTVTGQTTFNTSIHDAYGQTIFAGGATSSAWYKITLATNGVTPPSSQQWYMCSMTIHVGGSYGSAAKGIIEVSYYIYWTGTAFQAINVYAMGVGNNLQNLILYYKLTDPFVIYVNVASSYTSLWVDKVSYRDSSYAYRTNETKVEVSDAITTTDYSKIPIAKVYSTNGNNIFLNNSTFPSSNNLYNLGDPSYKWANVYSTNFKGNNITLSTTSGISYEGTKNTYQMIRFIDNTNDTYGNGIAIGGGGQTIIGGGESAGVMVSNAGTSGEEIMYVGNDTDVNIFTNLQNGWSNRKTFTFDTSGNLTATKFIGALQGNADTATTASKLGSSNIGSATQPIYLSGGTATACTYTLGKSVPSDAVFTDHYAWTDITGKPSTFTPSTHYHYELKTIGDQRTISTTPNDYVDKLIFRGLKNASAIGSPGGGSGYSYLVGLRGWGDSSGGDAHELAFNNNGIYCRHGATTTWGDWSKIFTSADTYTGTLTSSQVTTALGFTPTANTGTITSVKTTAGTHTTINVSSGAANFNVPTKTSHLTNDSGYVTTDTKNTAGSTDTSSKIYLVGATSQAANPQTYSDNEIFATSGVLTTKSIQVGGGSCTMQYNSTTQSLDFVFAS